MNTYLIPSNVRFSPHAASRLRQRGIRQEYVAYALLYGKRSKDPVETEIVLRRKDIKPQDRKQLHKASGLKVVFNSRTAEVITAYYPERSGKGVRIRPEESNLRRRGGR